MSKIVGYSDGVSFWHLDCLTEDDLSEEGEIEVVFEEDVLSREPCKKCNNKEDH